MKKKILAFIAMITCVVMTAGVAGCNLITTDNERDMNQVIATVSIDENVKNDITKRELIMAYLDYGYKYAQKYGYNQTQTMELLVNGLIKNKLILQTAMKDFNKGDVPFDGQVKNSSVTDVWSVDRYLSEDDVTEATYTVRKAVNDLLDSYDESKNVVLKQDSVIGTVRTVPTNATPKSKEITAVSEKADYNNNPFDITSSKERRDAYSSVVLLFKNNGLLGDKYDGTIESTSYYANSIQSSKETKLIQNYEKAFEDYTRRSLVVGEVEALSVLSKAYTDRIAEQKAWSNEEFLDALNNASYSAPTLYSANGTYGYVYNLLIGASEEQTKAIGEIRTNNPSISNEGYKTQRATILSTTTAKDLRSTWITSGYDFDGTCFTGDYTFAVDPANSLKFQGTTVKVSTGDQDDQYAVTSVTEFSLDGFTKLINTYVYGLDDGDARNTFTADTLMDLTGTTISEYDAKINELLFAFSTDSGSLNTYKGYVIKPAVEGSSQEPYVLAFAEAGRKLLENGKDTYTAVATDYGYHFMFFSEVFTADYTVADTLTEYLDILYGAKNWENELTSMLDGWDEYEDTDNFLYLLVSELSNANVSNAVSKMENDIVNLNTYDNNNVVKYQNRYSDLLG